MNEKRITSPMFTRRAKFSVCRLLLRSNPELVASIFSDLEIVPYRAELMFETNAVEYAAMSPYFGDVSDSCEPPTVRIVVTSGGKPRVLNAGEPQVAGDVCIAHGIPFAEQEDE